MTNIKKQKETKKKKMENQITKNPQNIKDNVMQANPSSPNQW